MVSVALFFCFLKESICGLSYLDSLQVFKLTLPDFPRFLFPGFLEATGENPGYFLPTLSSCLEEWGGVGITAAPAGAAGNAFLISQCYHCVPQERKQALRDSEAEFTSDTHLKLIQASGILVSKF